MCAVRHLNAREKRWMKSLRDNQKTFPMPKGSTVLYDDVLLEEKEINPSEYWDQIFKIANDCIIAADEIIDRLDSLFSKEDIYQCELIAADQDTNNISKFDEEPYPAIIDSNDYEYQQEKLL